MGQITEILTNMVKRGGSDLILKQDRPPLMRLHGKLLQSNFEVQTAEVLWDNVSEILNDFYTEKLGEEREVDLSFEIEGVARFRVNVFHQRGRVGTVIRAIPLETPTIDELKLPSVLKDVAMSPHGIILVTGPTGSGKSTTLAAVVEHINMSRHAHIITIEDPIEFVYTDKRATITQRGIGEDVLNAGRALRAALRQNPDVILAGEMRDRETMELALHAAETGHLVMSTLHTNDAKQSVTRITDSFPPENKTGLLRMLSVCLKAVVSQRLLPTADGSGRVAAHEIMIVSPTIKQLIEKGAIDDMAKAIESSSSYYRMQSFNQSLCNLVNSRKITAEAALANSSSPGDLKLMLKGMQRSGGGGTSQISRGDVEFRKAEGAEEAPKTEQRRRPAPGRRPAPRPTRRGMSGRKDSGENEKKSGEGGAPPTRKPKIKRGFDFS
ncbi:PilT/PilU family type 4a pilus ATPase [Planctomycetota bacterium]|nr:PilT/PilU family type 4a pilus ATPase [Planctomycetota bacterium]